jgi:periplasmic divalent cation tolerance protein
VWTTIGEDRADELARALVDDRLAACVNVHGPMMSTYRWKGAVEREPERQVFIKTTVERLPALEARLREIHSYELPELIVMAPESASTAYEAWVNEQTARG